jgi:hypothetical protein
VQVSTGQSGVTYELADDLIALHYAAKGDGTLSAEGMEISVEPAESVRRESPKDAAVGPVYRQAPGGEAVVPTGRALVRFAEGDSAERHRSGLAAAGFELEEVLAYAPHAAWVRARSGSISDTLQGLGRLARLPEVQHVEPQLIAKAARRP